jgi:serine kinase of HPr protein (carbohydrate metabolism regulator)
MINVHATLIDYNGKGILLTGKSGSGKSDVALRMIMDKGAKLVGDDRIILHRDGNVIFGKAPDVLAKKLEVRNVGIIEIENITDEIEVCLCVELCKDKTSLDRLPQNKCIDILGVDIPQIELYPFEVSTIHKIIQKISGKII